MYQNEAQDSLNAVVEGAFTYLVAFIVHGKCGEDFPTVIPTLINGHQI